MAIRVPQPPTSRQRWKDALHLRNAQREEIRRALLGKPQLPPPPVGEDADSQMMPLRGTRVVPQSHGEASRITTHSWKTRKEKFGRVGRGSKDSFKKR